MLSVVFLDHNTTGDGIISAVQLLRIMRESGQPLSELRKVLSKFPQAQRNVRVRRKPAFEEMEMAPLLAEVEAAQGDSGRVLLRYSGTEPLLRILIEGRDEEEINRQADALAEAVRTEIGE